MKNIFNKITAFLIVICSAFIFTGCKDETPTEPNDGFEKIQSITYILGEDKITLQSKVYFEYTTEETSEEEYNTATNKGVKYYTTGIIETNGTVKNETPYGFNNGEKPEDLNALVGTTHYYAEATYYYKLTYTKLTISYLQIKIIDDNTIELKYYNSSKKEFTTKKVKTTNYEITNFN